MKLRRASYFERDAAGNRQKRLSHKWYAVWMAFDGELRKMPLHESRETAKEYANKIDKLNTIRGSGEAVPRELSEFIKTCPPKIRDRLADFNVIEAVKMYGDRPLAEHIDGWEQAKKASGNTKDSIRPVVSRVRRIVGELGFVTWRDLNAPGAATKIKVWLGDLRAKEAINGTTANKFIGDIQDFCRWLKDQGFVEYAAQLESLDTTEIDEDHRRALSVDEMHRLVGAAASASRHHGLTGDERAILYRFAVETGIRPGQIADLTVGDFRLMDNPPTVTSQAKIVKRRKIHEQVLRPALAADLQRRFAAKMSSAPAFRMPDKHRLAEMLRVDLAAARLAWISEATTDQDRIERAKSDFLADVNHAGERVVFYSTRHGHGTALADAGVLEKDIAKSMHHSSRKTTARYLHSDRKRVTQAISALPDLAYTIPALATGTDDANISLSPNLPPQGAIRCNSTEPGAISGRLSENQEHAANSGGTADFSGETKMGRVGIEPTTHGFSVHCSTN